jgi:hypothetical protein
MLRISCKGKRTNEDVHKEIEFENEERLRQIMLRRKLGFFEHMRSNRMEKETMLANGEGKRKKGRPRKKWMDKIQERTEMNMAELRDATSDRKRW